jgi:PAS domain S-box-containing protein
VDTFPGFQAINWIDEAGVIRVVVPLAGNESVVDADLTRHPHVEVRDALRMAHEDRGPTRTAAFINLLQGGKGFATYWPIFDAQGNHSGYINAVLRVNEFVEACLSRIQVNNKFQIVVCESSGEVVYPSAGANPFQGRKDTFSVQIDVLDNPWKLALAPSPEYLRERRLAAHHLIIPFGIFTGLLLVGLDRIVAQRKAALESSRAQYSQLFEHAPVAYISASPGGVIKSANIAAEEFSGLSRDTLIGMSLFDFLPIEDGYRGEVENSLNLVREGEGIRFEEIQVRHADGSPRWVLASVEGIYNEQHKLTRFRFAITDISSRKEAEEERGRLSTVIEQAAEGVVITDARGYIQDANAAFLTSRGGAFSELDGKSIGSILREDGAGDELVTSLATAVRNGQPWQENISLQPAGTAPLHVFASLSPLFGEDGRLTNFVMHQRDVSHEAELENQLRQSNKMEAVGRLAGGIAHDFNNILHGLLGYATIAKRELTDVEKVAKCLDEIERSGNRASELVASILAFGRKSERPETARALPPIVEEIGELIRGSLPEEIRLEISLHDTHYPVEADPLQVHQILMNLASNATAAMKDGGGLLRISLDHVRLNRIEAAHIPGLNPGTYMRLRVEDTGVGMDDTTVERVFEPYFTTRDLGGGAGLGLATVHGLVENHRGAIRVESRLGEGSAFQVFLPIAPGAIEEPLKKQKKAQPPDTDDVVAPLPTDDVDTELRVLYVDDEPLIVDSMGQILTSLGYSVMGFTSSSEAIDAFSASPQDSMLS